MSMCVREPNRGNHSAMIKIPVKLDRVLKELVTASYEAAQKEISEEDLAYVEKTIDRTLLRLEQRPSKWNHELAKHSRLLWKVYNERTRPKPKLNEAAKRAILAALFYLCNPFDIVPDYTPGIGYCDDAMVINLCMKTVKKLCPDVYARHLNK